jgi:hypothetical protein
VVVSKENGQVMVELLAAIVSVAVTISFAGWFLKVEWDRGKCAYIVFEHTHAEVSNSTPPRTPPWFSAPIEIHDLPDTVQGSSQCGQAEESVMLPKLDPSSPDPGLGNDS